MKPGVNYKVRLFDEFGITVPGSTREGHNVFTSYGRAQLAQLFSFSSISISDAPDVTFSDKRIRWVGVGGGVQSSSVDVLSLNSPLVIEVIDGEPSYDSYLKEIDTSLITFPNLTTIQFKLVFASAELSITESVAVSESALYLDVNDGINGPLVRSIGTNTPAFYNTFEPLVKAVGFSLEILWELRF